jgi:hypothetical protein
VHGIVLVPDDQPATPDTGVVAGQRSVHAWVEDGDHVWDCGVLDDGRRIQFCAEKASYYDHYRIQETTKYTMYEVLELNRASGHFGPWKLEYREMLRKGDTCLT